MDPNTPAQNPPPDQPATDQPAAAPVDAVPPASGPPQSNFTPQRAGEIYDILVQQGPNPGIPKDEFIRRFVVGEQAQPEQVLPNEPETPSQTGFPTA